MAASVTSGMLMKSVLSPISRERLGKPASVSIRMARNLSRLRLPR